ncbi:MAG: alanine:cation symporter family protein [Phycisphaerales bacterium]|nr:alanine:cation symporter family protein [Phycisphaerales bacterium]
MDGFNDFIEMITGFIWADWVLYVVLGVGVLFTLWSGFSQYRALTHGVAVTRGKYDDPDDPGAISHFQALSAALSATVGLGNIAGVAIAIAIGGPGAVFWMWVVGILGMAIKTTEVAQSMLFRDTSDPNNPHGGPMFVVREGMKAWGLGWLGTIIGGIFCVTLLISAVTGGNMFQSWSVGGITEEVLQVEPWVSGLILAIVVAMVILGGIKRIGSVAGVLVPFMCLLYVITALVVLVMHIGELPAVFGMIFSSAFGASEAGGAFVGGAVGTAFLWGMKRALFSSECGQGSSPIAHSAAQTKEPISESVVAGLEPFIDTLVVCTLTALMILSTGALTRGTDDGEGADARFAQAPLVSHDADAGWILGTPTAFRDADSDPTSMAGRTELPERSEDSLRIDGAWRDGDRVFMVVTGGESVAEETGSNRAVFNGIVHLPEDPEAESYIRWKPIASDDGSVGIYASMIGSDTMPTAIPNVYEEYVGATLTAHAINRDLPGFGNWLILIAAWLFAISTMISWSYYGEQGVVYLFGTTLVPFYKIIYCLLIVVATLPLVKTAREIGNLSDLGTGIMLWANIPIMLLFGAYAMTKYHDYMRRLRNGELEPGAKKDGDAN